MLFTGQASINDMSGPVGVVSYIGETYQESQSSGGFYVWLNMLNISIFLTANLGVMNLLPIPALDGGRLVFLIIELIRGKRIDPEKEGMVYFVGLMLLMLLMVMVMFNDVRKIFFLSVKMLRLKIKTAIPVDHSVLCRLTIVKKVHKNRKKM